MQFANQKFKSHLLTPESYDKKNGTPGSSQKGRACGVPFFNYLIPHREHSSGLHSHSIPVFSPNANTAFLTHSGRGHKGTPVSIPCDMLPPLS